MLKKFNKKEFFAGLNLFRGDLWGKSIIFMIRHFIVFGLIFSAIAGTFYYRGRMGKPIHVNLNYEKSFTLSLNGTTLYKPKNSSQLELLDKDGKKIKDITVKDIPELRKALRPYGMDIQPIFTVGYGTGERHSGQEIGVGYQLLRYFKWHVTGFATNRGVYGGVDYRFSDNSGVLGAIGKGYKGDDRVYLGGYWRF